MAEKDDDKSGKLDTKALQEALSNLPKAVQEAVIKGIKETVAEDRALKARKTSEEDEEDDDEDEGEGQDEIDIERVGRKDLVKYLESRFGKALAKALKPIEKKIEGVNSNTERDKLIRAFQETKTKYKDFDQWKDEIKGVAESNPLLTPEQMYLLARAQNPDKAKEIDGKVAKEQEKAEKDKKAPFGGLLPTSGKGAEENNSKMNSKDAATKAWDQAMSSVPPELIGESG